MRVPLNQAALYQPALLARKRTEPLTFSTCPTGAEQQRRDQRSNPSESFTPQRHVEATGCCRLQSCLSEGRQSVCLSVLPPPLLLSPLRLDALLQLRSGTLRCAAVALLPQSGGAVRYPAGRMLSHRSLSVKWWRGTRREGFYETVVGPSRAHRLPSPRSWRLSEFLRGVPGLDSQGACGWPLLHV